MRGGGDGGGVGDEGDVVRGGGCAWRAGGWCGGGWSGEVGAGRRGEWRARNAAVLALRRLLPAAVMSALERGMSEMMHAIASGAPPGSRRSVARVVANERQKPRSLRS